MHWMRFCRAFTTNCVYSHTPGFAGTGRVRPSTRRRSCTRPTSKLTAGETPSFEDRTHFFALAARAMRFVLISYARERTAQKRGGGTPDLPLNEAVAVSASDAADTEALDLLSLDAALDLLTSVSDRLAKVVEYRFFGGMTHKEIAEATGRSVPTVKRDWRRARTYLFQYMKDA